MSSDLLVHLLHVLHRCPQIDGAHGLAKRLLLLHLRLRRFVLLPVQASSTEYETSDCLMRQATARMAVFVRLGNHNSRCMPKSNLSNLPTTQCFIRPFCCAVSTTASNLLYTLHNVQLLNIVTTVKYVPAHAVLAVLTAPVACLLGSVVSYAGVGPDQSLCPTLMCRSRQSSPRSTLHVWQQMV